ncbi:MAG: aminotransferase class I/II-fold pyridoxal phosphate-dependent enzyme [Deltaproteobacteria bacterium]|nr:aminotransferase class I/II-fold pyridoxal phosphate-dependent enzyme [Deltaproteobacteria bacterium]
MFRTDLEESDYSVDLDVPHLKHMMCLNESWENPWQLLRSAFIRELDQVSLNRYYDDVSLNLKEMLSKYAGSNVSPKQLIYGNGADEMLYFVFVAVREEKNDFALSLNPSYFDYSTYSKSIGLNIQYCDLDENFDFDVERYVEKSKDPHCKLCILCNPNNPTGNLFDIEKIKFVLENTEKPVLLDETYFEFSKISLVDELDNYPNLIIVRSFSKAFAGAGLRFGYMISSEQNISHLMKTRTAFHSSLLVQSFALTILKNRQVFEVLVKKTIEEKNKIFTGLESIEGITAHETFTNFIPFNAGYKTVQMFEYLKSRDFALRLVGGHPSFGKHLRVTPQSPAVNVRFIEAVKSMPGR